MTRALPLVLILAAGCAGSPPIDPTGPTAGTGPSLVDHEGTTVPFKSGFWHSYTEGADEYRYLVLTNMDDGCASLAWWDQREATLSDMFFAYPFDEPTFEEAIANTQADFADEMSTDKPWYAFIEVGPLDDGVEVELPGADRSSEWGDPVFWAYATQLTAPTYESDTTTSGTFRTWGPDGYEAYAVGGTLTVQFDGTSASGAITTTFETDELAQFDLDWAFDVPRCTDAFDWD